ncbi:MAG: T9SS type A sorting domain-containing protein [Ignavibacteriales bacterium]|nr:T9SS type A sorting domain-containing protein [Ignavibacteriales bacterium]
MEYTFSQWNDGNTSYSRTFYPNATTTYTANYTGKPTNSGEYVSAGGTVGQPVVVTWTDNPNTAVNQFQIWRRVKHNGVTGDPVLLTTVGRGVQSYTDYDYAVTNGYTNDLLWYDVRAYYSTEGTYSDPEYTAVYGIENPNIQSQDGQFITTTTEIPTDYSISNYPNPFNPTTTINYQLPQDGFVTIKVYDLLGKEVAALVNENKSAGYHRVNFDASKLTSGVYVYTITANNFVLSKKMLLMK